MKTDRDGNAIPTGLGSLPLPRPLNAHIPYELQSILWIGGPCSE